MLATIWGGGTGLIDSSVDVDLGRLQPVAQPQCRGCRRGRSWPARGVLASSSGLGLSGCRGRRSRRSANSLSRVMAWPLLLRIMAILRPDRAPVAADAGRHRERHAEQAVGAVDLAVEQVVPGGRPRGLLHRRRRRGRARRSSPSSLAMMIDAQSVRAMKPSFTLRSTLAASGGRAARRWWSSWLAAAAGRQQAPTAGVRTTAPGHLQERSSVHARNLRVDPGRARFPWVTRR